jgi:hypothetical protein
MAIGAALMPKRRERASRTVHLFFRRRDREIPLRDQLKAVTNTHLLFRAEMHSGRHTRLYTRFGSENLLLIATMGQRLNLQPILPPAFFFIDAESKLADLVY